MKKIWSVLVTGAISKEAVKKLSQDDRYNLKFKPDLSREDLFKHIKDVHILITRSETAVDKELLSRAGNLKIIVRAAVGVGNIDLDVATSRGILVINTPGKNTNSAAELTFALLLSMMRNVPQAHSHVKNGHWERHQFTGLELKGKKIGIVGLGNVGHRMAKFAHGFDMDVSGCDPYIANEKFLHYDVKEYPDITSLAKNIQILTVHVPLNDQTRYMIDHSVISKMTPGSFLLNTSRGAVVNEDHVLKALDKGHLAGVGIDTWENEPSLNKKLVAHPKVWCSPHIGASTYEAQELIGETVIEQLNKAVDGFVVDYPVNLPHMGTANLSLVKPYTILSEKLGSLAAQLLNFNISRVEILYRGGLADLDQSFIKLGFMKGYSERVVTEYVSYVNAQSHFERLGIKVEESLDKDFQSYKSALKIVLSNSKGEKLSVGGIVFEQEIIRLSLINNFYFEIKPDGHFLVIENEDKPGVIGDVGAYLAKKNVNIESFILSRESPGGIALALVKLDGQIPSDHVEEMIDIPFIKSVRAVRL